ncbi:FG-GAP-like repeat-containing protein [Kribbella sp. NPDC055071]
MRLVVVLALVVQSNAWADLVPVAYDPALVASPSETVAADLSAPTGTRGTASVGNDGASQYDVPLRLVQGRGGFGPRLALNYSSSRGRGQLGVGFALSGLSEIGRCRQSIAVEQKALGVRLNAADPFCLDGQKLRPVGGVNGADGTVYRTVPDTFVKVMSSRAADTSDLVRGPTSFTVWSPDGVIREYGQNTGTTRVSLGNGQSANVAWSLVRESDRSGNVISYEYGSSHGLDGYETERWIDNIFYGSADKLDRRVRFGYLDRVDKRSGFQVGGGRVSAKLLETVTTGLQVGGAWKDARVYKLGYEKSGSGQSRLTTLTECGLVANTRCMRSTKFAWSNSVEGFAPGTVQVAQSGAWMAPASRASQLIAADLNGDGRSDLAWADPQQWKYAFAGPGTSSGSNTYTSIAAGDATDPVLQVKTPGWATDFDGDGLTDLIPATSAWANWSPRLTTSGGSFRRVLTNYPWSPFVQAPSASSGALTGDFDGDGNLDVLEAEKNGPWSWTWRRRTGRVDASVASHGPNPYDHDVAFEAPKLASTMGESPAHTIVTDLDGDGRDEAVQFYESGALIHDPTGKEPWGNPGLDVPRDADKKFVDLNGDGLVDLVANSSGGDNGKSLYYWVNTGRKFLGPFYTGVELSTVEGLRAAEVTDYDNDGRRDLLVPRSGVGATTYTGLDVVRSVDPVGTEFVHLTKSATSVSFAATSIEDFAQQGVRVVDANADGLDDLLVVARPPLGSPDATPSLQLYLHQRSGAPTVHGDLLTEIREGNQAPGNGGAFPATVSFKYAQAVPGATYNLGDCGYLEQKSCLLNPAMSLVQEMTRDAGRSDNSVMTSTYKYAEGVVDRAARSFLGFGNIRVVNDNPADGHGPTYAKNFFATSVAGKDPTMYAHWEIRSLPNGDVSMDTTSFSSADQPTVPAGNSHRYLTAKTTRSYEFDFPQPGSIAPLEVGEFGEFGKFPFRTVTVTDTQPDAYGNLRNHAVTSSAGGRSAETETNTTYDNDSGQWLLRRPQKVITTDAVNNGPGAPAVPSQTRTTITTYEGATPRPDTVEVYGSDAQRGRETKTFFDYASDGQLMRRKSVDRTGQVDGQAREAVLTYDDFGYLHASKNALEQISYTNYDPLLGVLKVAVDANGLRTDFTYDNLSRLLKTKVPGGALTTVGYVPEQVSNENLLRVDTRDDSGAVRQVVYDRLGRVKLDRFAGMDKAMRESVRTYEPGGLLASVSTYHRAGTQGPIDKITYVYDDLGRMIRKTEPKSEPSSAVPVSTWTYDALVTTATDSRGKVKKTSVDHRGQAIQQIDGTGGADEATRIYEYGTFGTLSRTWVSGVPNSTSTYLYDALGAQTSSTDPERGTTSAVLNGFGEPIRSTDAAGRVTTAMYDVLGRLTRRSTVSKDGTELGIAANTYDSVQTGEPRTRKGMLLQTTWADQTADGATTSIDYFYDNLSQLQRSSYTVPRTPGWDQPGPLSVSYDHDTLGRTTAIHYPELTGQGAGTKVNYIYGSPITSNGRLMAVTSGEGTGQPLWKANNTDDADRLTSESAGNSTIDTKRIYDWRGSVLDLETTTLATDQLVLPSPIFSERYGYDTEGNLETRVSRTQTGMKEQFAYDDLNRLKSSKIVENTSTLQTDTLGYDDLGNLTSSTLRGAYGYDSTKPTQATSVTGGVFGNWVYGYDQLGRQTTRDGATVTYNPFDLPATITSSSGTKQAEFLYYGTGQQARKTTPDQIITTIPQLYERRAERDGTIQHHLTVSAEGRQIATMAFIEAPMRPAVTPQPTLYNHTDRMGSTVAVSKETGQQSGPLAVEVESRSYDALGKQRNPDWRITGAAAYTTGITDRTIDNGFTGHQDHPELDLTAMGARFYDPQLGRFTTPDTVVDGANATQAFNRYSYVSNNPLKYTDPTGHVRNAAGEEICIACTSFAKMGEYYDSGGAPGTYDTTQTDIIDEYQEYNEAQDAREQRDRRERQEQAARDKLAKALKEAIDTFNNLDWSDPATEDTGTDPGTGDQTPTQTGSGITCGAGDNGGGPDEPGEPEGGTGEDASPDELYWDMRQPMESGEFESPDKVTEDNVSKVDEIAKANGWSVDPSYSGEWEVGENPLAEEEKEAAAKEEGDGKPGLLERAIDAILNWAPITPNPLPPDSDPMWDRPWSHKFLPAPPTGLGLPAGSPAAVPVRPTTAPAPVEIPLFRSFGFP